MRVPINAWKIDSSRLPKKVFQYRLKNAYFMDNPYEVLAGKVAILSNNEEYIYSIEKIEEDNFEFIKELPLYDLEDFTQEKLLGRWLRYTFHKQRKIREIKKAIIKGLRLKKGVRIPYVFNKSFELDIGKIEIEVLKYEEKFWMVMDFRFSINATENLWDYVGRNKEELRKLARGNSRIRFILNEEGKTARIVRIEEDEKILLDTIEYIKQNYNSDGIENIDMKQPVVFGEIGNKEYPYIPELSKLVFSLEDLDEEDRKKLTNIWNLTNEDRFNVLESVVKSVFENSEIMNVPLEVPFEEYSTPVIVVKNVEGEERKIKTTYHIFNWIDDEKSEKYVPWEVPEILPGSISTYILIDNNLVRSEAVKTVIDSIISRYNKLRQIDDRVPYLDFRGKVYTFSLNELDEVLSKIKKDDNIGFAFIIGAQNYKYTDDYYDELKRRLFDKNILSQNVIFENMRNSNVRKNLMLQILAKLGIKYFALSYKMPFDYVLGIDVGNDLYGRRRIGGCSVIFDSYGKIKKIVPVEVPSDGETLDLPMILRKVMDKGNLEFKGARILVLRDGRLISQEIEKLSTLSKSWNASITLIGVRKSHKYRIKTNNKYGIGISLDRRGLLLPHYVKGKGYKPIMIYPKLVYDEKGDTEINKVSHEDLKILWSLTKLNYSVLFGKYLNLRLPAPIHYADRFVKALGRGWKIEDKFLNEGMLYFV